MRNYAKGVFTPSNRQKYIGKNFPTYRSSWQLRAFISLDKNPAVSKWGSQNFIIPYVDTTRNNQTHRYVIDLFFQLSDEYHKSGYPIKWLIQIKPYQQATIQPGKKRRSVKRQIQDTITVQRNRCKWKAAVGFCKSKGWHFGVYTEKGITKMC